MRSMLRSAIVMKEGLAKRLGTGVSVNILRDRWANGVRPQVKEDVILRDFKWFRTARNLMGTDKNWNDAHLEKLFDDKTIQLVKTVHIPHTEQQDGIFWLHTKDGNSTTKSGYKFLQQHQLQPESERNRRMWKLLWKCMIPEKWKAFV